MASAPDDLAGFARRTEQLLLQPDLPEIEVAKSCETARSAQLGAVVVRPCDIDVAVRILGETETQPASVAGFPHGDSNTGVKLYELRDLLRRGAKEILLVLNTAKLRSRQFQHVETELMQAADACRKENATLTALLETCYLNDEMKIVACRICSRAEVQFVGHATGFAREVPAAPEIRLLRSHLPEDIGVAAIGIATSEAAAEALELGASRIGSPSAVGLLAAYRSRSASPAGPAS